MGVTSWRKHQPYQRNVKLLWKRYIPGIAPMLLFVYTLCKRQCINLHFLRHVLSFQGKIIISSSSDAVTYFKFELYHWISASKSNRKYLEMSLCMKDARLCFSSFKNRNTRINGDAYIWDWIKTEHSCETSRSPQRISTCTSTKLTSG